MNASGQAPLTIKRTDNSIVPGSYADLRQAAIAKVQEMSGSQWTDYNVHDPGVTIIEQLCFRMSELIYRSDFPVQDYLVDDEDQLDLGRHGLVAAHEIFPARAATAVDLRKVIISSVEGLDNAWVDGNHHGLLAVTLCIRPNSMHQTDAIVDHVRRICGRNRNLCEDFVNDIVVVPRRVCTLHADIEVSRDEHTAEIVAKVLFMAGRHIAGSLRYQSFRSALESGTVLDEVFSGPMLANGIVSDESLGATDRPVQIAELLTIMRRVDGVERVNELYLSVDGINYRQSVARTHGNSYLALEFRADSAAETGIAVTMNNRVLRVASADVARRLERLEFSDNAGQRSLKSARSLTRKPCGKRRSLAQYASVQDLLPPAYGVGQLGALSAERPAQAARLRQLKAYLLIFDQIMADFAAGLDGLGDLYSIEPGVSSSYQSNPLGNEVVRGADELYVEQPDDFVDRLTRSDDNFIDRRNRLLDTLLALYGETFPDSELRSCYSDLSSEQLGSDLIRAKLAFLRNIVKLTRDRGAGFDYLRGAWNTANLGGLQARASLFLGFAEIRERSLVSPFLELGQRVVTHEQYRSSSNEQLSIADIEIDAGFKRVPARLRMKSLDLKDLRQRAERMNVFGVGTLSAALLQHGTDISQYRIGRLKDKPGWRLVLRPGQHSPWWLVAVEDTRQSCIELAHGLKLLLVDLNRRCEGMHVVEHLLLRRSRNDKDVQAPNIIDDPAFLSHRITVVLPGWTPRFADDAFRMLASEVIRSNTPAHVHAELVWFEFSDMCRFESLYSLWLKKKRQAPRGSLEIDDIASQLALFLVTRGDYRPDSDDKVHYV